VLDAGFVVPDANAFGNTFRWNSLLISYGVFLGIVADTKTQKPEQQQREK
jgi:hypothetical protein